VIAVSRLREEEVNNEVTREIELPAETATVWGALTRGDRLSAWFGAEVEIEARPGGRATFTWPDGTERAAVVEAIEPRRLLVLRWLPFLRGPGGSRPQTPGLIRFVLRPTLGGTRLTVTEARVSDEPPVDLVGPHRRLESPQFEGWTGPRALASTGRRQ
jgi:uncharacterized protein YndB with AHSA1/START domain